MCEMQQTDKGFNKNLTNTEKSGSVKLEDFTKAQLNFIEYCKKFGWGKLEVIIKDGQPVMVSPIKQDIKLD